MIKLEHLLPYSVHKIEEKVSMRTEDSIQKAKEERYWNNHHKNKRTREDWYEKTNLSIINNSNLRPQ
mgnify:CR=1 FL=1